MADAKKPRRSSPRKKTIRREAFEGVEPLDEERPNIGRIIENGLTMLMPFIVERIVASATAPERHPPAPPLDMRAGGNVVKRCTKCPASLLVPLAWVWCPLCGESMGAVS